MGGFFIPGIGQGGGQVPNNAITGAAIRDTELIFTREDGTTLSVPLNANNVAYDNTNVDLNADDVQEAIEILKEELDKNPTVHVESDNNSLQTLIGLGELKFGDIIYVENSTGVLDHTGKNVDNGTDPVVFIYDDTVGGNHLRLISRVGNYAHRDRDNLFTGENTFKDLYVYDDDSIKSASYVIDTNPSGFGGRVWTGLRSVSTELLRDHYVSKIRVYTNEIASNPVTGIEVFPVTKNADKGTDVVQDKLDIPSEYAKVNENGLYYFDVHINKDFSANTYFIIGSSAVGNAGRLESAGNFNNDDKVNLNGSPRVGIGIPNETNNSFVVKYEVFGREIIQQAMSEWDRLNHTSEPTYKNLFNPRKVTRGEYYVRHVHGGNTFYTQTDDTWSSYVHKIPTGKQIRIVKKTHDSSTHYLLDKDKNRIGEVNPTQKNINNWKVYDITIPENMTNAVYMGFNLHNQTLSGTNNNLNDFVGTVMIFDNHTDVPTEYVPFFESGNARIDGEYVKTFLDTSKTNLKSNYLDDAIVELDNNKFDKDILQYGTKAFDRRDNVFDSAFFRIPALVRTKAGTLLAFSDIRQKSFNDHSFIHCGVTRSLDDGLTWQDHQIAVHNDNQDQTYSRAMDSTAVVTNTGKIIVMVGCWHQNNLWTSGTVKPKADWDVKLGVSTDDGLTWAESSIKGKIRYPSANGDQFIGWLGGVGSGIVMKNHQDHPNRIIMPIQISFSTGQAQSGCIFSDDDGENWTMSTTFADTNTSENMILELRDGSLIMSARRDGRVGRRGAYISTDGGVNWKLYAPLHGEFEHGNANNSGCQGSWIKYVAKNGHEVGLLSHPKNETNTWKRDNITVFMYDFDNPRLGIKELYIPYPNECHWGGGGYSSMNYGLNKYGKEVLGIVFEDDGSTTYKDISFLLDKIDNIVSKEDVKWSDLEHVEETYSFENLFCNTEKFKDTGSWNTSGGTDNGNNKYWTRYAIPVEKGKTYYLSNVRCKDYSQASDILGSSVVLSYETNDNTFNNGTKRHNATWTPTIVDGKNVLSYTAHANATHIAFAVFTGTTGAGVNQSNAKDELMIWDADLPFPNAYVECKTVEKIIIDGSEVDTTFDSETGLLSPTVRQALDELNNKINVGASDVRFDTNNNPATNKPNNTLYKNVGGAEQEVINHVVTQWTDLEHTLKTEHENVLDFANKVDNKWYGDVGESGVNLTPNQTHSVLYVPFNTGEQVTILKRINDNVNRVFFTGSDETTITGGNIQFDQIANGWFKGVATYADNRLKRIAIQFNNQQISKRDIMVFRGDVTPTHNYYVPYGASADKIVIGTGVEHEFDPMASGLKSNTVDDAIRELSQKIDDKAVGGIGTVTSVNGVRDARGNVLLQGESFQNEANEKVRIKVGNVENFAVIDCMQQGDVDEIKLLFI